jgi:hypothetical protein
VYGKLFSELRYLKDIRNKFAHYLVVVYPNANKPPKEFHLLNYRNGVEVKIFSKGDFDLFNKRLEKCIEEIGKLKP